MLSTRGPLRFENNPSFFWKISAPGGDQIADRCPGIYPGSGEIPVRKLDDLCCFVYKVNIDFAPFAVAVCLIQVGCGGDFLFPACYRFLFQIHDPAYFIFCQLTDQAVQGGLVGKLPAFFCAAAGKNRNLPERESSISSASLIPRIDEILKQPNCPFVLFEGNKKLVKRKAFEAYIDGKVAI